MPAAAADEVGLDGRSRWLSSFKALIRRTRKADTLQPLRLLLVASVLVPMLLFAAAAWQSYQKTIEEAEMEVRKTVSILHEHARKVFETHELLIARVDDHIRDMSWEAIGHSESLHTYLRMVAAGLPQVDAIWLAAPNGLVRSRSHLSPAPDILVADEDYFAAQRARNAGTYVSRSRHDRPAADTLNVTRRRTTADGTFDGTLTVAVSLDYFRRFYTDITPLHDHVAGLIRMDGDILVRNPAPAAFQRLPDSSGFRKAIKLADEGLFTAPSAIDGVARISGYSKLAGYPVYVVFGLDKNAVLGEWHQDLLAYGIIAVPAAAGLFLLTWFALRKSMAHRLALQRWQQERELCGLLVNSSSDGILAYDHHLRCTLWNPAMEAISGLSGERMRGKDLRHILPSVRGTLIEPVIRNALAGAGNGAGIGDAAEQRFWPANADARNPLETRSGPLRDWDGKIIGGLCFVRDRTEQRRLEEELRRAEAAEARREAEREAEQRLADIAANFPGHIYRRILHRDDRISHPYLGHTADTILRFQPSGAKEPLPLEEFARQYIHPDDASRWREAVLVSARTLSPYRLEFRVIDSHGDVHWLRSDARAYRGEDGTVIWDGVAIDITDLKETEEALRESDERMSLAAEAAELGPWSWDIARRRVRWSDRCKAILGLPPETESSCERLLSTVHPEDRDRVHEAVRSALDERRGYEAEFRVIWPDGSQHWVLDKGSALYDVNDVPVRMSGVIVDITARKLAELERQQKG
ncbi:PAS domain-containing protein [Rhodospirillaceae bacterium SYSU D60014]|uniref:PAS domain-containing protein n=1 Tax=Virgifigura deserti TaxID=2268457 RepID=UPI0013C4D651